MIQLPIWAAILIALIMVALVLIVWSTKRRRRPRLDLDSETGGDGDLMQTIAGLTQSTVVGGNRIELIQNGQYFERLFADLEAAKKTINFETFLCKEGEATRRLAEIVCRKRADGVKVQMMMDGSGSKHFGKEDVKRMRAAGAEVHFYHPLRPSNLGRINNRDHRKIVIIDGRLGYIGGHCFVDTWLGNAEDKKHFRDVTARVEGPVVGQLQSVFAENWIEETGDVPGGDEYFPQLEPCGESEAHVAWVSPAGAPSTVKLLHYLAIRAATKSITLQNPYFLPDPDARKALLEAVKRGVKVRVMLPADTASDAPVVQHASHHHFGTLLKAGVRIFEYQRTLLHQKVFTIDHRWSAVGSTNFDDRSFEVNDEVSMAIYDEKVASELEAIFEKDLEHATEVHLEKWKKRPALHKMKDFLLFLFNEQM
ncbi:MAG TPA: phospholipase D-like domain-containing protein [Thermoanaerobaculia bacterium]|nr:phospholipase D-like domain-containing protein [Thermoanaerobaculia bacterium]